MTLLMTSVILATISSSFATFSFPFNYQTQRGQPSGQRGPSPPIPMFKPISRTGPPNLQRRDPAPLVFPGSLSKTHLSKMRDNFRAMTAGLPMRTYMYQLRGSPSRGMAQYAKAPPDFKYLKPNSSPSPTIVVKPIKYEKHSNLINTRPTSDYTFEKPHLHTTKLQLRLPVDANAGAIRTIPAPNLSVKDNQIQFFSDNKEPPKIPFKRPSHVQQYEVEEQTNDVTFKDPYSGKNSLWAPDPDPTFPNPRVKPSTDPLSRPSNYQSLPSDLAAQIAQAQQYVTSSAQHSQPLVAAAPVAYVQSQTPYDYHAYAYSYVPMQAAASSPAGNTIYQPSMLQGMSPYNPSYLVTQSNQLFNQHQQNLYNKQQQQEPAYIQDFTQNSLNYNPYAAKLQQQQQYNAYDVAAAQLQQIQALQAAATQLQYQDQTQGIPYNPHYPNTNENSGESQYTQLIEGQDYNPYATSTQAPLTAKDLASIFKYGTLAQNSEESNEQLSNSYSNAAYYNQYGQQVQQDQPQVQQGHFQPSHGVSTGSELLQGQETLTPQSAFEQHQQALAAQLNQVNSQATPQYQSHGSLRIYVPDDAQAKSDENVEDDTQTSDVDPTAAEDRLDENYYDGIEYQYSDDNNEYQSEGTSSTSPTPTNHKLESKE